MPPPSDRLDGPEPPRRPFVGREDLIEAFDAAYGDLGPDERRVMHVHGVGGIGKSELLRELIRRLNYLHPRTVTARVDFTDREARIDTTALARARQALRAHVPFPTFDVAYAHWWSLAYPHVPLAKAEIPFLDEGEIVGDLVEAASEIPGIGLVAKIPRALGKAGGAVRTWWTKRGSDELKALAGLTDPSDVAAHLRAFWAADVRAWQAETGRRAVLFLDTMEALGEAERSGVRGGAPDDWVREWAGHLGGVLVVTAGRLDLTWSKRYPEWADRLTSHPVGDLNEGDAEAFLVSAGVEEEDVRRTVVERARGLPLYLDLAADTYARIADAEGRPPRPEEFDATLGVLLDRFLHYLDVAQRAAVVKLAVPATFDRVRFRDLMTTFGTGSPATADGLAALRAFPFIEEIEPGRYALHDLVREALAAADAADPDRAAERREVHAHLFAEAEAALAQVDYRAVTAEDERALREAVEHQWTLVDVEAWIKWYWTVDEPFRQAARWSVLQPLREHHLRTCKSALGQKHLDTLLSANNLAYTLHARGELDAAEPLFRRALSGRESILGSTHPATLASLNNLAALLLTRRDFDGAEPLYRQALAGHEAVLGPDHPSTLASVNNLGALLHELGDLSGAESLIRRALSGRESELGPTNPETLISLNNLAVLLGSRGDIAGAEALHRRSLAAHESVLGRDHPDTLNSWSNLAYLLHEHGNLDGAEPLYRRALAGLEEILGPDHPDTLRSANNLAYLLHSRGDLGGAEVLFRRIVIGNETVFGTDHPDTLRTISNLAVLLDSRGDLDGAESLYRRALARGQERLGAEHPMTQFYCENLNVFLGTRREKDDEA